MPEVSVSYSRRDFGFVRRLTDAMSEQGGKEVWLDTEGIRDGEVFPEAIKRAIEQSDTFLFVITPNAVNSPYCETEVEYARQMQKRILPVLREPVPDAELPAEIRDRNWIPFAEDEDFAPGIGRLLTALDTDLEAAKAHTGWLVKALEWNLKRRDNSFLLRGSELKAAEQWLASRPDDADPAPTPLRREYLLASRTAAARRQRMLVIGAKAQAVSERIGARAQAQLPNDPEISLILGMRAVREKATPESLFALRAALDASPLERALPTISNPGGCLSAAFSPDGRQVAEGTCSGLVRILDAATGRVLRSNNIGVQVYSLAYSPDGETIAAATGNAGVWLIDPQTGTGGAWDGAALATDPAGSWVAFSPGGRTLAASFGSGLITGPTKATTARPELNAQLGGNVVSSPNGRLLFVGGQAGSPL